ncbi:MAG: DUF4364 family protein, partial [Lachnospiraceae bacterium]|nr:DUF4364 family protein [Lachnospiraceae bacterium]
MSEFSLKNQILILELLYQCKDPLSNAMINDFFSSGSFAHYFTVQETLHGLLDDGCIQMHSTPNMSFYKLTNTGEAALLPYRSELTPEEKKAVVSFLRAHRQSLVQRKKISAIWYRAVEGGFQCDLKAVENGKTLVDISIHLPT